MHPAFSYSCITLDKIRDMAKKKHKGHYCKICGEYKPNESFSRKGHVQHICKECMGEMKKSNKKILDLPFGDNEFEIVDADEYIDTILYGNNEERENKVCIDIFLCIPTKFIQLFCYTFRTYLVHLI